MPARTLTANHRTPHQQALDDILIRPREVAEVLEGLRVPLAHDVGLDVTVEGPHELPRVAVRPVVVICGIAVVRREFADGVLIRAQALEHGKPACEVLYAAGLGDCCLEGRAIGRVDTIGALLVRHRVLLRHRHGDRDAPLGGQGEDTARLNYAVLVTRHASSDGLVVPVQLVRAVREERPDDRRQVDGKAGLEGGARLVHFVVAHAEFLRREAQLVKELPNRDAELRQGLTSRRDLGHLLPQGKVELEVLAGQPRGGRRAVRTRLGRRGNLLLETLGDVALGKLVVVREVSGVDVYFLRLRLDGKLEVLVLRFALFDAGRWIGVGIHRSIVFGV